MISTGKRKINKKVLVRSSIAFLCIILMFLVSWLFILPVAIILWLNQRDLFSKGR
ncbi:MAG: hypothetical protein AABX85_02330 [Nanoarchaeota archaeon]